MHAHYILIKVCGFIVSMKVLVVYEVFEYIRKKAYCSFIHYTCDYCVLNEL